MKLYFAPNTCSLASHIVLEELGLPYQAVKVNNQTKRTADDQDYLTINPKGYVAALVRDDGEVITEAPVILQYLDSLKPDAGLAPPAGSLERWRLLERLNFIGSELHPKVALLFNRDWPEAVLHSAREKLFKRVDYLEGHLDPQRPFDLSDAYLFAVLGWFTRVGLSLSQWPRLHSWHQATAQRPAVQRALAAQEA
ncbi:MULTISPECIES: glutathione S-transferase N-terminal domain-containing protein [unclassified Pseudomonas]|uniref:glutathione S-transferase N-terminal domain-containing protein n=1 Tax=unclassified Pseudomonas TaxID=196821 RepID=UPI000BD185D0|nr:MULTISPECIES: glutathione S-transferase N-terminal domain-containing protein [unclassified Pseudomonas]PVZ13867.1 glutathione S-transferase [Pseudomonas sp. URIL14HWK12:I12]PVZ24173.1 glutathione S-transferase [Pseudomonas sp. URIL14HWK12:I10]PVZ33188.1 glutathione S-transferase [Pseudomonas sp. URIL14HWK12:I11]SNZ10655.1 glutathione S-transferase [Pseudomonas sp. URIL14HWK12:I9]